MEHVFADTIKAMIDYWMSTAMESYINLIASLELVGQLVMMLQQRGEPLNEVRTDAYDD